MSTVDLKDAYFLVRIHDDYKKYLRFQFCEKLYEFNVMPFGLNVAPYVFTKLMKPVAGLLRSCGHLSTIYLDDYLLISPNLDSCLENISDTTKLLEALGFIINTEKSNLSPSTSCKFLGFIIKSDTLQVTLPQEKVLKIKNTISKFFAMKRCRIREFASLVGLLTSACPAVKYGLLYTKELERCKYLNLKDDENYNKYMNIPSSLLPDLKWWYRSITCSGNKIKQKEFSLEIFSDASTTGWGAACGSERASGIWTTEERTRHINNLEILAAFFGLKVFAKNFRDSDILLRIDNTTAVSYINRMGGIQFPHLTKVTRELWQWCEERNLTVFASYIPSIDNVVADAESRRVHPDIEWELAHFAFQKIIRRFGTPEIDLFASRINKKCPKYISWHRDPDALGIDAFTLCWSNFYFYCFPPFAVILKVLRKIIDDGAHGIMVVPLWPTQAWYPLFKSLLITEPLYFNPSKTLIVSHCSNRDVHQRITLVAGLLSGRHF